MDAYCGRLCVPTPAGLFENVLDMHFHLPEERSCNGIPVALVSQDGHSLLDAQRLENCLRYPERQAVERPEEQWKWLGGLHADIVPICMVNEERLRQVPEDVRQYLRALRRSILELNQPMSRPN